ETRQPLLVNRDVEAYIAAHGLETPVQQGESAQSVLFVPMVVGDQVRGRISLQNVDHADAFSDADVRLLSTLAASLSVALANVRLFDEPKRLLSEKQRVSSPAAT